MGGVVGVQDGCQGGVLVAEAVQEVLCEYPSDVAVDGLLDCYYNKLLMAYECKLECKNNT